MVIISITWQFKYDNCYFVPFPIRVYTSVKSCNYTWKVCVLMYGQLHSKCFLRSSFFLENIFELILDVEWFKGIIRQKAKLWSIVKYTLCIQHKITIKQTFRCCTVSQSLNSNPCNLMKIEIFYSLYPIDIECSFSKKTYILYEIKEFASTCFIVCPHTVTVIYTTISRRDWNINVINNDKYTRKGESCKNCEKLFHIYFYLYIYALRFMTVHN